MLTNHIREQALPNYDTIVSTRQLGVKLSLPFSLFYLLLKGNFRNMTNKATVTAVLRGKTSFAKILGDPVLNYSKDGKEWKMDLILPKEAIKEVKALGIGDRVKTKDNYADGQPFMTFKQAELRRDGTPNQPIKVYDIANRPWDESKLIGNGSDVDVKFVVMDHGPGKKKGVYIRSVRVLNLVPYAQEEFAPIDENDPYFEQYKATAEETAQFKQDFGLEDDLDDVPFE